MATELMVLAWGSILALVHIFAAANVKTKQYGRDWNVGARDEALPPPEPIVGRMMRAQANFFETFPVMVAAVAIISIAGLETRWTAIGAVLWLVCRALYLPVYAMGTRYVRTVLFLASFVGLLMTLWPALF